MRIVVFRRHPEHLSKLCMKMNFLGDKTKHKWFFILKYPFHLIFKKKVTANFKKQCTMEQTDTHTHEQDKLVLQDNINLISHF